MKNTNKSFENEIVESFIPRIEKMIEQENKHLNIMITKRDRYEKFSKFRKLFYGDFIQELNLYISNSYMNLTYMKMKVAEYKNFIQK